MATGDITWFNEARTLDYFAGWASTDDIKIAVLDNTTAPTAATATPALGDFTEVGTAGSYVAGGTSVGDWGTVWSQAGGTGTMDSATNPTWAQNASNDTDAHWGLAYNATQAGNPAMFFVELGGPVNMTTGPLTVTWNASGMATLTQA
ncbi:hypothetical protein [Ruegeria jejuensis]|uniref:hypothetical protein n=1 Tax=Ruegeria jejuensis TaxID=3233338 RepID=UPI00355BC673